MSWPMVEIGKHITKVVTWNPIKSGTDEVFSYIDLSSVDKDKKQIIINDVAEILSSNAPSRARQLVKTNDVIVSTVRPILNGVALVPLQLNGATASTGYCVLRADEKALHSKYLFYWTQTSAFVKDMMSKESGANYPAVSDKIIKESQIPLPPLAEQKRIATILDKADAIHRKRQQAIQLADEFLRSVFLDMFGVLVTDKGYDEADKFKIKDLIDYVDYRGKTPAKSDKGIPLITAKNVKKGFVDHEPREFIPEENYESWMTRGLPLENDVLFTTEAPLGNVALLGKYERVVVGQRLIALRSKGKLTHEFLMFLLLHPFIQGLIFNRSSGSTVKGIRTKEFYEIELPVPEKGLQERFSEIYWKANSLIRSEHKSIGLNDGLFGSLSQKAFSGEL